jgi:predicted site-specific integrase-resolvase
LNGKIKAIRTTGGHRRFDLNQVKAMLDDEKLRDKRVTVIYARVSTSNKKDGLNRQIERLESFCMAKGWEYKTISDIGSGINYNKKGLQKLIEMIISNQVERVVINYKDRLVRFGYELIEKICNLKSVEVIIVSQDENKTFQQETIEDILSIFTVFSAKLYGSRSHKNKKITEYLKKIKETINDKDS